MGRRRVGQEGISKIKERVVSGLASFFGRKGTAGVFILRITPAVLTRKFQIDCHFWEGFKLQLSLSLVSLGADDSVLDLLLLFLFSFLKKTVSSP